MEFISYLVLSSDTAYQCIYRGYYMAAWGYEFYLRVLKVSLTSERSEGVRECNDIIYADCKTCLNRVNPLIWT